MDNNKKSENKKLWFDHIIFITQLDQHRQKKDEAVDLFPLAFFPHCPLKRLLLSREPQRLAALFSLFPVPPTNKSFFFFFPLIFPAPLHRFSLFITYFSSLLPLSKKYTLFDGSCYSTCFPRLGSSVALVPVHPGVFTLYTSPIYLCCRLK